MDGEGSLVIQRRDRSLVQHLEGSVSSSAFGLGNGEGEETSSDFSAQLKRESQYRFPGVGK